MNPIKLQLLFKCLICVNILCTVSPIYSAENCIKHLVTSFNSSLKESLIRARQTLLLQPHVTVQTEQSWNESNFTLPQNHDPQNFRYIVHGVVKNYHSHYTKYYEQLIENPQSLSENFLISASVINEKNKNIYGHKLGFILKVPQKNIFATNPDDMGTSHIGTVGFLSTNRKTSHQELLQQNRYYGIQNPEEILMRTKPDNYNEILLTGNNGNNKVEVIGIISYNDSESLKLANELSKQFHLPLVILTDD